MDLIYYFNNNKDEHGLHEIHAENCEYLPEESNRTKIGLFPDCSHAFMNASIKYPNMKFDGCYHCCPECHKG